MKDFTSEVLQNRKLSPYYYELLFKWDKSAGEPHPGQFVTITPSISTDPLLRRPFAVSSYDRKNNSAAVVIQIRGKGTEMMSCLQTGDKVAILGPLGNGFTLCSNNRIPILAAGGTGLGPMLFLLDEFLKLKIEPLFIAGFRDKDRIISSVPEPANDRSVICTDDGSEGFQGTVADYIKTVPIPRLRASCLYACGPLPMMKACHTIAADNDIPCFVSMEEMMGCAVGACMGCVIPAAENKNEKYYRVCKDGPVFESRNLKWT